jgi:hypothetical protein
MRCDRELDDEPRYHAHFWNCHDIGLCFAFLAVEDHGNPARIQKIAICFESGKNAAWTAGMVVHWAAGAGGLFLSSATAVALATTGIGLFFAGGLACFCADKSTWHAKDNRYRWINALKQ